MAGVTQKELAEALGITSRQVRNLTDEGVLQRTRQSGSLVYDMGDAVQAYVRFKVEREAKAGSSKEELFELQRRKLEIEVEVAELALAQQRGQLVTLDYMEHQIRGLLEALRARCLNLPGKYARECADASEPATVTDILESAVAELLQSLSETGDDPELDPDDDEGEANADDA